MTVALGFLGLGSAFEAYARQIGELQAEGEVSVVAGFDPASERKQVAEGLFPSIDADVSSAEALVERADVDAVLVLTTIPSHGPLTERALRAGKLCSWRNPRCLARRGPRRGPCGQERWSRRCLRAARRAVANVSGIARSGEGQGCRRDTFGARAIRVEGS